MMTILTGSGKVITSGGFILINAASPVAEPFGFTDPDNWERYVGNPILTVGAPGTWDDNWVHPYSFIDMGDGTYRMYYGGAGAGGMSGIPEKVGFATSLDGYTWSKYGSNPILSQGAGGTWDDNRIEHFCILKEGSNWYAWYAGEPGDGSWKIGYATSSDGISWTKYGGNPVMTGTVSEWDSYFVVPSSVIKEGSTYYMFYWGGPVNSQLNWQFGLATSTDRINWTKSGDNPIMDGGPGDWDDEPLDYHVQKIGDTYFMFYQSNTSDGVYSAIGAATSPDRVNWTKATTTNSFPRGANGTWDDTWNEGPTLFKIGSTWLMYYMGQPGSGPMEIGVMTFIPP